MRRDKQVSYYLVLFLLLLGLALGHWRIRENCKFLNF